MQEDALLDDERRWREGPEIIAQRVKESEEEMKNSEISLALETYEKDLQIALDKAILLVAKYHAGQREGAAMRYMISDIHGCYEEYRKLLDEIQFSDEDELYILGDAMDRGPEPIKVIQDIMARPNTVYIIGNHDYTMFYVMKKLTVEVTEGNYANHLSSDDLMVYSLWIQDGGDITSRQFAALSREEQQDILKYLENASLYEVLEDEGRRFVLVHSGIDGFSEDKELDEYDFLDFISARPDYDKRYYQDKDTYVVTGHTPTALIRTDRKPEVYQGNGHIAIDCGCVFGGNLAAYCVETGEVTYIGRKTQ